MAVVSKKIPAPDKVKVKTALLSDAQTQGNSIAVTTNKVSPASGSVKR